MKILMLTTHFNYGGISRYILNLSRGLSARGNSVTVASSGGDALKALEESGVRHLHIPIRTKFELSLRIVMCLFKLIPFIKREKIDIIHSHTRVTQILGSILGNLTKVVYVSTCHGFFKKRIVRKIFPCWGKRVIAISDAVKEHLVRDFGIKPHRVKMVYNGVDSLRLSEMNQQDTDRLRDKFGLKKGPVVGIVARLSEVKGHRFLIEAMQKVIEEFPGAELFIVGEGRLKEALRRLVTSLGMEKSVVFYPSVPDTYEVLSVMDVFAMPSLQEGLGLALMEAMAAGLPIVASDIGGIPALIKDGYNGLLVKPGDSGALAEAILSLLRDKHRASLTGKVARDFITKNFSLEKMAEETERVYREVSAVS